ncbi:MAG TPA: polysaccharide biosynthesis/export family protein [Candidatus Binataceae bacterium]|nr:polysaccharide biosynthesis/export family protein [Candidatus Binataceae bacterium]
MIDINRAVLSIVHRKAAGVALLSWSLMIVGCAASAPPPASPAKPSAAIPAASFNTSINSSDDQTAADLQRLAELWKERTRSLADDDYPIGPGDILQISVPSIDVLKDRSVRVSGDNTIALPLIGELRVAGFTESKLRDALARRLDKYMYDPQIEVFVKEYRSRQVAVTGAVDKPGHYNLTGRTDTVLDMITLAGGLRDDAAEQIILIPAESDEGKPIETPTRPHQSKMLGDQLGISSGSNPHGAAMVKRARASLSPVVISLRNVDLGSDTTNYLALPVRPRDVIVVPSSGSVMVEGWVRNPGAVKITPGLTVLGAVAAVGGPLFAADTESVKIIRSGKQGDKIVLQSDLEQIMHRRMPDLEVQHNDVIVVDYSNTAIVPYFFYMLFNRFGIGAGIP